MGKILGWSLCRKYLRGGESEVKVEGRGVSAWRKRGSKKAFAGRQHDILERFRLRGNKGPPVPQYRSPPISVGDYTSPVALWHQQAEHFEFAGPEHLQSTSKSIRQTKTWHDSLSNCFPENYIPWFSNSSSSRNTIFSLSHEPSGRREIYISRQVEILLSCSDPILSMAHICCQDFVLKNAHQQLKKGR